MSSQTKDPCSYLRNNYYRKYFTTPIMKFLAECKVPGADRIGFYLPSAILIYGAAFGVSCLGFGVLPCIVVVGLMGSVVQGRPTCDAQKLIEKNKPILSAIVGAVNWNLCCLLTAGVVAVMPFGIAGAVVGFLVATAISSVMMCEIEQCAYDPSVYFTKENFSKKLENIKDMFKQKEGAAAQSCCG